MLLVFGYDKRVSIVFSVSSLRIFKIGMFFSILFTAITMKISYFVSTAKRWEVITVISAAYKHLSALTYSVFFL